MDGSGRADDTSPEARAVLRALYASMTPVEKLERVRQLTLMSNQAAFAGLAARHPGESRQELLVRLARMRLGDELVDRVYGPRRGP